MKLKEGVYYSDAQNKFYLIHKTTNRNVWVMFSNEGSFCYFKVCKQSNIPKNYLYLGKL